MIYSCVTVCAYVFRNIGGRVFISSFTLPHGWRGVPQRDLFRISGCWRTAREAGAQSIGEEWVAFKLRTTPGANHFILVCCLFPCSTYGTLGRLQWSMLYCSFEFFSNKRGLVGFRCDSGERGLFYHTSGKTWGTPPNHFVSSGDHNLLKNFRTRS
jgi:hypothetical protein